MGKEVFPARQTDAPHARKTRVQRNSMRWLLYGATCLLPLSSLFISGCARMGSPDGGWYDEDPPRILYSTPADRATNVSDKKISIYFDEYIKLKDPSQSVIISPPQLEMPEIKAAGKKIVIELADTLKPDMTYTVDFSNAITDNNEDNPLGNYTYSFSTGEHIDTFQVAGYVIDAMNLEPVSDIMVGLYADLTDSAFRTKPLLRVGRTDGNGHFVIKGVAPGEYRAYALKDADGDYKFSQKSEVIAFSRETIIPSARLDTRQDTIWRDTLHIDSIATIQYMHFYPDDIVLKAFQEVQTDRYLVKTERKEPDRLSIIFTYGNPRLPVIRGLNFKADSAFVVESNARKDSLTYWLRDTLLVQQDTLLFAMDYLATDTAGNLALQTDTIEVLAKPPFEKRQKEKQKAFEEWQKEQEKKKKRDEPYDSIYPVRHLEPRYTIPQMTPKSAVTIEMPTPLARLDTAAIHLYSKIDTLWYRAPFLFHNKDSLPRTYLLLAEWVPGREYSLEVDSAAFTDIYGLSTKEYKQGIKVQSLDEFSTIIIELSGQPEGSIVAQLVDKSDNPVMQTQVESDGSAQFYYVAPGAYYVRAFRDLNGNEKWDTGNYDAGQPAEEVYYYPREIEAKAKWDITQQWNMADPKASRQKPAALVKQKSSSQPQRKVSRNAERAKELGIEYIKKVKK